MADPAGCNAYCGTGYFAWRGIAPGPGALPSDWGGEIWGDGVRFGGCCIDGGRCYWFAVANGPAGRKDEPGGKSGTIWPPWRIGCGINGVDFAGAWPWAATAVPSVSQRAMERVIEVIGRDYTGGMGVRQ